MSNIPIVTLSSTSLPLPSISGIVKYVWDRATDGKVFSNSESYPQHGYRAFGSFNPTSQYPIGSPESIIESFNELLATVHGTLVKLGCPQSFISNHTRRLMEITSSLALQDVNNENFMSDCNLLLCFGMWFIRKSQVCINKPKEAACNDLDHHFCYTTKRYFKLITSLMLLYYGASFVFNSFLVLVKVKGVSDCLLCEYDQKLKDIKMLETKVLEYFDNTQTTHLDGVQSAEPSASPQQNEVKCLFEKISVLYKGNTHHLTEILDNMIDRFYQVGGASSEKKEAGKVTPYFDSPIKFGNHLLLLNRLKSQQDVGKQQAKVAYLGYPDPSLHMPASYYSLQIASTDFQNQRDLYRKKNKVRYR